MKAARACDVNLAKLSYPLMVLPKIDGVRGLVQEDRLVARSGKSFANELNTFFYSDPRFNGFDGEMVVDRVTGSGICNATTSALTTIKGQIQTRFCLFDFVVPGITDGLGYQSRYKLMIKRVTGLLAEHPELSQWLWPMPSRIIYNERELLLYEMDRIEAGFEGIIIRSIEGPYKHGRSTQNEGYYLRLKRFIDSEIRVTYIIEGKHNTNEQTRTPNGYAERATHAENMVPNGKVGTVCGIALADVRHAGKTVIKKGDEIELAAGKLTHPQREEFFQDPSLIVGKIAKFQFFPVGIKDKPRFPTFQSFRDPVDM